MPRLALRRRTPGSVVMHSRFSHDATYVARTNCHRHRTGQQCCAVLSRHPRQLHYQQHINRHIPSQYHPHCLQGTLPSTPTPSTTQLLWGMPLPSPASTCKHVANISEVTLQTVQDLDTPAGPVVAVAGAGVCRESPAQ